MIYIKLFEDFTPITEEQIINCIKDNGSLIINFVEGYEGDDKDEPWSAVSVSGDTVTVEKEGKFYDIKLKNIKEIKYGI